MNTIQDYFSQAQLSLAAYAYLIHGKPNQSELIKAGFSLEQAAQFASTYSVVDTHSDITGLSVTVFADSAGHKYLAIRGTQDMQDLYSDVVDISLLGTSALQSRTKRVSIAIIMAGRMGLPH